MRFLSDLDGLTIFLTGISVVLVLVFLGLLWGSYGNRWPKENAGMLGLLLAVAIFCSVVAHTAYCPDADQPHIQRTGLITPFKSYAYSVGRHSTRTGILECVGPCGHDVPLMEFDALIMARLARRELSSGLTVTYLGRKELANIGSGYSITAHPVVEIDDASTSDRIFYIDTTRHWSRMIVLLTDALVCILTFVFCLVRVESASAEEDGSSFQSDRVHPMPDELTGLGWASKKGRNPRAEPESECLFGL
jgi:hypothetical protein